jgi:hypothetical protein
MKWGIDNMNKKGNTGGEIIAAIFILLLVGSILFVFLSVDMVDASHEGIMVNMGTIKGVMTPGIKYTGLFTSVKQYDMRIRKTVVEMEGNQYAPDKTGQQIYATIAVNYRLKSEAIQTVYQHVGTDDVVVDKLNIIPIITEGFKRATVKYEALEILDKREEVAHLAEQNIRDRFPSEYFEIESVVISNIHYSEQFQKAIDDKKTAIQLTAVAQQNLEKVKFEQEQEVEKSKAVAMQLQLQKEQVTPLLVQMEFVKKWTGSMPLYMITLSGDDKSNPMNMLLSLPEGGAK